MKYLKQFVIGSSYLVFVPFYYAVQHQQPKKTYQYYDYTLIAPVWFGIWNIISLVLADYFDLTIRQRFILVSLLSSISVMIIATYLKSYTFTPDEWKQYYLKIFIKYMLVWNIVIGNIEKYL
tara:strand:- start:64 stop:429 length:366 start_codon:yes stop_codon:yes gene_type:complete